VTSEAYNQAVSENHEFAVQMLERAGMSRNRQQEILQRYLERMRKDET
jgi:hypothetical protein